MDTRPTSGQIWIARAWPPGFINPRMKAFIFDLDGTLINSLEDLADAVNLMLAEHGYPSRPLELFPQYIGEGVQKLVERALPSECLPSANLAALVGDYQRHYESTWKNKTRPYDGMADALDSLRLRGLKIAVLSNKPHHFTKLCCDHFFAAGTFHAVLGARDGVPRKPHPQAAHELASQLGVATSDCAYVGDSGLDMQFAVNAGMYPVGVLWGFRSEAELRENGAQQLLSRPWELPGLCEIKRC